MGLTSPFTHNTASAPITWQRNGICFSITGACWAQKSNELYKHADRKGPRKQHLLRWHIQVWHLNLRVTTMASCLWRRLVHRHQIHTDKQLSLWCDVAGGSHTHTHTAITLNNTFAHKKKQQSTRWKPWNKTDVFRCVDEVCMQKRVLAWAHVGCRAGDRGTMEHVFSETGRGRKEEAGSSFQLGHI